MVDYIGLFLSKNFLQATTIPYIQLVESRLRVYVGLLSRGQIIDDDDLMPLFNEPIHNM